MKSGSKKVSGVHGPAESVADAGRRSFLLRSTLGLGALSLADLAQGATTGGVLGTAGQFPASAKRVIFLHMLGAISQVDTFDYKPTLVKMHGQELPASVRGTARVSNMVVGQSSFPVVGPLTKFRQYGQSGTWVSDYMQHTGQIVDDLCFIKTLNTEHVNHDPASKFIHTGFQLGGRPSAGSWVSYALGADNMDLPAFIVMTSGQPNGVPLDAGTWSAGYLPSHFQGVQFRPGATPVPYIGNPGGVTFKDRRDLLDVVAGLAKSQLDVSRDPEILSKVSQYEMAYRMQASVPEVADLSDEPRHVLDMYGPDVEKPDSFAHNCLLARRLAERNVKYIQLFHMGWDHHTNIIQNLPGQCRAVDQPAAALVRDLKQRGLLEDTLVVFGSEFGRTSFAQGPMNAQVGRDHHGGNFTYWLAGGGTRAGYTHGETDEFSYNIAKDPVHVHDFQATLLHLLGIDHERLTVRYQGRDFRLTDVYGKL